VFVIYMCSGVICICDCVFIVIENVVQDCEGVLELNVVV